jgi:hypothetical protein
MELLYSSRDGRSNWTHFREAVEGKPNILTIFQTEEDFIVATYLNQPYSYGGDIYDCNAMIMSVTKRRSFRINKSLNPDCLAAYIYRYGDLIDYLSIYLRDYYG